MILHPRVSECVELFLPVIELIAHHRKEIFQYYDTIPTKSLLYFNSLTASISSNNFIFWMNGGYGGYVSIDESTTFTPMRICPTILSHISHEIGNIHHSNDVLVKYLDSNKILPYPCPEEVFFQKSLVNELFELEQYEGLIHTVRSVIPTGVEVSFSLGSDANKVLLPNFLCIQTTLEKIQEMIDEVT